RVFDIDITLCPLCGGQLRVIGDITDPGLIRKILDHLNVEDAEWQIVIHNLSGGASSERM
ncbi:MAG: hypothetical protein O3A63_19105, partial [Proteobacteria bacterium]|nr:hypothetical protein [Pseudomonadota bacterium]